MNLYDLKLHIIKLFKYICNINMFYILKPKNLFKFCEILCNIYYNFFKQLIYSIILST